MPQINLGDPVVFETGDDLAVIVTGIQTNFCIQIAKELKEQNIHITLIGMPTLKPIDEKILLDAIKDCKKTLTIEEHSVIGGLGAAVGEILERHHWQGKIQRLGINDAFPRKVGTSDWLRTEYGLDKENIKKTILKLLGKKP